MFVGWFPFVSVWVFLCVLLVLWSVVSSVAFGVFAIVFLFGMVLLVLIVVMVTGPNPHHSQMFPCLPTFWFVYVIKLN